MKWPLISDEGGYAYGAQWWFQGLTLYSDQLWFDRPQGIFLVYKLGMALFGTQTWAIRLWGTIWAMGTGVFLYRITERLTNHRYATIASIIYTFFSTMPQIEGFTSNAEVFALLPATASAYFLLREKYSIAGLFVSMAFLLKPSGGSIVFLGIIWLIFNKTSWKNIFQFLIFSISLIILACIHGSISVGISKYWTTIAGYRLNLHGYPTINVISNFYKTSIVWLPLLILSIIGYKDIEFKKKVFLFSWFISSFLGMAIGKNWEYHYFIQIIPPLAFGSSIGLLSIWNTKNHLVKLPIFSLLLFSLAFFSFFIFIKPDTGAWILFHRPGYQKAHEITQYIKNHTKPEEIIYVAFFEAEYYFLSNRRSAVPYLYRLQVLYYPGAYEEIISAIYHGIPAYVVALDPPVTSIDPENRFEKVLINSYNIETYIEGVPIYKRKVDPH
ncbi:MAG: glycosyltransferase family 39 protein [Chloroflexi bacterium]|nr:glycosyltransferase family 39 protein [Chloroflexota bacterium]